MLYLSQYFFFSHPSCCHLLLFRRRATSIVYFRPSFRPSVFTFALTSVHLLKQWTRWAPIAPRCTCLHPICTSVVRRRRGFKCQILAGVKLWFNSQSLLSPSHSSKQQRRQYYYYFFWQLKKLIRCLSTRNNICMYMKAPFCRSNKARLGLLLSTMYGHGQTSV